MADKRSFLAHLVELDSTYEKIHSLPHLSAFEAAARLGSFSAAADELFLTTGAVSRHIRSLEEQLGITLFYRGHKSVRLTQAGENFSRTASRSDKRTVCCGKHTESERRPAAAGGAQPADVHHALADAEAGGVQ